VHQRVDAVVTVVDPAECLYGLAEVGQIDHRGGHIGTR
jgi:hypothetical protein